MSQCLDSFINGLMVVQIEIPFIKNMGNINVSIIYIMLVVSNTLMLYYMI